MKNLFIISSLIFIYSCADQVSTEQKTSKNSTINYYNAKGECQGTTYSIIYSDPSQRDFRVSFDSIFQQIDLSLSVYVKTSLISQFNEVPDSIIVDEHFFRVFEKSQEIYALTNHCFDPSINPLIEFWGFGLKGITPIKMKEAQPKVDSLMAFIGMDNLTLLKGNNNTLIAKKKDYRTTLNSNAIAQGYSVDVIASFLNKKGIKNYLIEVGGELRTKGVNDQQIIWRVGIDQPIASKEFARKLQAIISLENLSLATSGNYRKFHEIDGVRYSHTISPLSGYPAKKKILSATVITTDCMSADAYATAFMVMGYEKAIAFLEAHPFLKGYLIYSDEDGKLATYQSQGLTIKPVE